MGLKQKYFQRLDDLKNNSNIGQLLYAAEQCLEHASLISWEINYDKKRTEYQQLRNLVKKIREDRHL